MIRAARARPIPLWPTLLVLGGIVLLRMPALAQTCVGDCPPPDGRVAVNELVLGVTIALGGPRSVPVRHSTRTATAPSASPSWSPR